MDEERTTSFEAEIPLRLGLGGPRIGRVETVVADANGITVRGQIDNHLVPTELVRQLIGDVRQLSVADVRPYLERSRSDRLRWKVYSWWYSVREALARTILPDGPWDDDY